jgi:hypothetical protein
MSGMPLQSIASGARRRNSPRSVRLAMLTQSRGSAWTNTSSKSGGSGSSLKASPLRSVT